MSQRSSAREKLLAAADELFYAEGIHTVGIDRVIEKAGVAKASLYSAFGSKEELVRAYLLLRHERRQRRLTEVIDRYDDPRAKLLGIFDYLGDFHGQATFRGCPFVNASAESPAGGAVQAVSDLTRDWVRSLVRGLVAELGVADPDPLTDQLILLYDGCTVAARLDRNPAAARTARAAAETLLGAYSQNLAPSAA
jgi:AcrR family transcriptional regulator